ncbi:hypothetical protein E4G67_05435 [Candidatus Bathyarchaeota archaeon]|nr:MAG: hypothetical protein E4G67_05435 [Candidatus Bathyarchaeota archaeon]
MLKELIKNFLFGKTVELQSKPQDYIMVYAPVRLMAAKANDVYVVPNPATCATLFNKGVKVGFVTVPKNGDGGFRAFRFDRMRLLSPVSPSDRTSAPVIEAKVQVG